MFTASHLRALLGAVVLSSTAAITPAAAQGVFSLPPLDLSPAAGQTQTQTQTTQTTPAEDPAATATAPAADPAVLAFAASPELRAANQTTFLDGLRELNPDVANELAPHDLIGMLEPVIAKYQLRTDNLADTYTVWLMTHHAIVNGDEAESTQAQVAGTRNLVSDTLLRMPELAEASDADKQSLSDNLLLQTMFSQMLYDSVKEVNPAALPETVAEVRQMTMEMGMDLDLLEMTENGLVAKQ